MRALAERLGAACGIDPMITARNDGDLGTVRLRIGRADMRRVLGDPTLNPDPLPTAVPAARWLSTRQSTTN